MTFLDSLMEAAENKIFAVSMIVVFLIGPIAWTLAGEIAGQAIILTGFFSPFVYLLIEERKRAKKEENKILEMFLKIKNPESIYNDLSDAQKEYPIVKDRINKRMAQLRAQKVD